MNQNPNIAFTLRLTPFRKEYDKRQIIVTVYDDLGWASNGGIKISCEVRHGGKVIFPRGQLWGSLPPGRSSDGIAAREHALAMVAIKPGDTDEDFFKDYSPEQLAWLKEYAEHVDMIRSDRYCDPQDGSCKE